MADTPLVTLHKTVQSLILPNAGRGPGPWYDANEIRKLLGLRVAVYFQLAEDELLIQFDHTNGGLQTRPIINPSGLYKLMLRSRRPGAAYFRNWVAGTVLPCIYQHGMYMPEADTLLHGASHSRASDVIPGATRISDKVFRSNSQAGHAIQDWVTRVVLPSVHKGGAYVYGEEKLLTGELTETELIRRGQKGAASILAARDCQAA